MDEYFLKRWPETYFPSVSRHNNLTVSSLGPAFSGGAPILSTYYKYPHSVAVGLAFAAASLAKRRPDSVKMARTAAFIHSQWSRGYYHWVTESLPRAREVMREYPDCEILIPKIYNSFHPESLELLGAKFTHFPSHNIRLEQGILTSCPKHYGTTDRELLLEVRNRIKDRNTSNLDIGKRIYISRALARGRKVTNEPEVVKLLERYDFEVLMPENYSFRDQASIFGNANFTVGIHGAGLSNILFMDVGSSVIELLPFRNGIFDTRPNSMSYKHDNCYLVLSEDLGHRYKYLQCSHDKRFYERTSLANITVDCESLENSVKNLIEEMA
jgi:capsular polysaccharide biosynthesis protein